MTNDRDTDERTDTEQYRTKLNEASQDGGGCTEMWETMNDLRGQSHREHSPGCSASRRSILTGVIGSIVAFLASTVGVSAASTRNKERKQAIAKYDTPEESRNMFENHGAEILRELAAADLIDTPSVSEFQTDALLSTKEFQHQIEGMRLTPAKVDDVSTAHLTISKETQTHVIEVNLFPQVGETYALVEAKNSDDVTVIDPDDTIGTTRYCYTDLVCLGCCDLLICVRDAVYEKECCVGLGGNKSCDLQRTSKCCYE